MTEFSVTKGRRHRLLLAVVILVVAATMPPGIASADDDDNGDNDEGHRNAVVEAVTDLDVRINRALEVKLFFDPGRTRVASGGNVTFRSVNRSGLPDEVADHGPHTATIVDKDELPTTVEEVLACFDTGPCSLAAGHVDENFEPIPGQEVLNEGQPGLDTRGDSLFIGVPSDAAADEISATVSASAGTRLSYLCAIHPWMQGQVRVAE